MACQLLRVWIPWCCASPGLALAPCTPCTFDRWPPVPSQKLPPNGTKLPLCGSRRVHNCQAVRLPSICGLVYTHSLASAATAPPPSPTAADVYMIDEPSSYLDVRQRLKAAEVRGCCQLSSSVMLRSQHGMLAVQALRVHVRLLCPPCAACRPLRPLAARWLALDQQSHACRGRLTIDRLLSPCAGHPQPAGARQVCDCGGARSVGCAAGYLDSWCC